MYKITAYCQYYEIGRVELNQVFRCFYKSLEILFLMPVKSLRIEYNNFYDDLLTIIFP